MTDGKGKSIFNKLSTGLYLATLIHATYAGNYGWYLSWPMIVITSFALALGKTVHEDGRLETLKFVKESKKEIIILFGKFFLVGLFMYYSKH